MKYGTVSPRKEKELGKKCFSSRIMKNRPCISIIRLQGMISKKARNSMQIEMWLNYSTQQAKCATWSSKQEALVKIGKLGREIRILKNKMSKEEASCI